MKIVYGVIVFIIIAAIGLSLFLQPNDFSLCPMNEKPTSREGCRPVQAIVAVSGGDTTARTNHAIMLYKHEWAPLLIFSGAAEDKSGPSNAHAMRDIALAAGVPYESIIIEEESEDTQQNAQKTKRLLEQRGITSIILVTSGYHQRRASMEFGRALGRTVSISNSPTTDRDWNWWWWITPRGWYLAVSEFARIVALQAGGQ